MRSNLCAFLAVLLSFSASLSAATLTPLGDLPGGDFRSVATAVSADGSTVVGFSGLGAGQEAFRWTSGGGMIGLGDLSGGTFESSASGVSADGSVVVGWGTWGTSFPSREAFRWTSGGGMVGLGVLPGCLPSSEAWGVSADGSVVVGVSNSAAYEAFRWTSGGGMVGLGGLPGGVPSSEAWGVSGDGSVVVGTGFSAFASGPEAFRWTSDGGMVGLGVLPGGDHSGAFGVTADGSVVVGWGRSNNAEFRPDFEASRWTSDGGMVGLGDLPDGLFESFATGVSGDGSIVVGYGDSASGTEAFLWTSHGGMKRLWDVLLAQGIDPAADGWTNFIVANGISADGNTIVGFGTRNGNTEAFLAVVSKPAPLELLMARIDELVLDDLLHDGIGRSLTVRLMAVQDALAREQEHISFKMLDSMLHELGALSAAGRMDNDVAGELIAALQAIGTRSTMSVVAVPEPSSLALLALAVPALFRRRHPSRCPVRNLC